MNVIEMIKIELIDSKRLCDLGLEDPSMKMFYDEADQKIEKWTKFFYFIGVKVMPISYWLPRLIIAYIYYFTTEFGHDVFAFSFTPW